MTGRSSSTIQTVAVNFSGPHVLRLSEAPSFVILLNIDWKIPLTCHINSVGSVKRNLPVV